MVPSRTWPARSWSRPIATLALIALAAAASPEVRGDVILASNLATPPSISSFFIGVGFAGSTSNGVFTNEAPAQEITAAASGLVGKITATVDQFDAGGVPLTVSITSANGSAPGTLLGSKTFAPSQVSSNGFAAPSVFDFTSAGVSLTAGQNYFVTFTVATPISGSTRYRALLLNTPNPIAFGFDPLYSKDGGSTWQSEGIPNEIGLTLSSIPEPGPMALTTAGGLLVAGAAWVRRRPAGRP